MQAMCRESGLGQRQGVPRGPKKERTTNMRLMSVTREVSQFVTFSSNVAKFWKSPFMSVIDETTQPEIGP